MDQSELKKEYARLIVRRAINLQEGQPLLVRTEVGQRDFAEELAEAAYRIGASLVELNFTDPLLSRMRVDRTLKDEYLDFIPSHYTNMYESYLKDGWASIALRGPEYPDIMEGADSERVGRVNRALSIAKRSFLKGISANKIAWNVCLYPTEAWAGKVLGSLDNWQERIWEILKPILKLDSSDPSGAWREHDEELKRRCRYMNENRFSAIHFTGPGTDLYVKMAPDRTFAGGSCVNSSGVRFFPNIPTEEIFSTPDHTGTEGHVRTTRPVEVLGTQVKGAWFEFSQGRVVEFGADENRDILAQYLDFDKGASALGEVALVDAGSPIFKSGRIFNNILLDENATCHIALGNGYTDCIEKGTEMTDEQLKEVNCNSSLVHTDFMIGSPEVSVSGVNRNGDEIRLIENGDFVI
ncbi:MAG: aminopeptidase [Candidatus Aegiribacteria sp.]|nr:aminopeptidase [Candidatus Aegiribacteria sp.]MBD3294218.1 aminopeptidase [Candidatus Fermentibacteria bacterium]